MPSIKATAKSVFEVNCFVRSCRIAVRLLAATALAIAVHDLSYAAPPATLFPTEPAGQDVGHFQRGGLLQAGLRRDLPDEGRRELRDAAGRDRYRLHRPGDQRPAGLQHPLQHPRPPRRPDQSAHPRAERRRQDLGAVQQAAQDRRGGRRAWSTAAGASRALGTEARRRARRPRKSITGGTIPWPTWSSRPTPRCKSACGPGRRSCPAMSSLDDPGDRLRGPFRNTERLGPDRHDRLLLPRPRSERGRNGRSSCARN